MLLHTMYIDNFFSTMLLTCLLFTPCVTLCCLFTLLCFILSRSQLQMRTCSQLQWDTWSSWKTTKYQQLKSTNPPSLTQWKAQKLLLSKRWKCVGDGEKQNGAVWGHVTESDVGTGDGGMSRWLWAGGMLWMLVRVCMLLLICGCFVLFKKLF